MDVKELLQLVNTKYDWHYILKPEQANIIELVLKGKNVFGILPTGYGKSLTYMLPPLLLDEVSAGFAPSTNCVKQVVFWSDT